MEVCQRGVKLKYFPQFIRQNRISSTQTTEEVCRDIVKKKTVEGDKCFYDLIPPEFKGPAQVFVSHSWRQPLQRVTDLLLKGRITSKCNSNICVWFDLFAVHQNGGPKQNKDLHSINAVIKNCRKTVLLLDQRDDEKIPSMLTRMWCFYEIYLTYKYSGNFVIVFDGPFRSEARFPTVKIKYGDISKIEDKEMIMDEIGEKIGEVDRVLNQILHQIWTIRSMGPVLMQWTGFWFLAARFILQYFDQVLPFLSVFLNWVICVVNYFIIMLLEDGYSPRTAISLFFWIICYPVVIFIDMVYNPINLFWTPKIFILWYSVLIFTIFIIWIFVLALRKTFPGFWDLFATEVGAIAGFFTLAMIMNCTYFVLASVIVRRVLGWPITFDIPFAIKAVYSNIFILIICMAVVWFGYFRYRSLNHAVTLRKKQSSCWNLFWSCYTFGMERLVSPQFVLGMRRIQETERVSPLASLEIGPVGSTRLD